MAGSRAPTVVSKKDYDAVRRQMESMAPSAKYGREVSSALIQEELAAREDQERWNRSYNEAKLGQEMRHTDAYHLHGQAEMGKVTQQQNLINMDLIWNVGIFALILFFFVGPSLSAILHILGSMNIWLWIGLLLVGLIIWRARS